MRAWTNVLSERGTERCMGPDPVRRLETGARHLKATTRSLHFILKNKRNSPERKRGGRKAPG